ncbi:hypothetical protein BC828DRAFT_380064 [Blastocladiella britannica]|nr:hypothetical protein BC828DRAFT_380064 [Blastocladiella britannica]
MKATIFATVAIAAVAVAAPSYGYKSESSVVKSTATYPATTPSGYDSAKPTATKTPCSDDVKPTYGASSSAAYEVPATSAAYDDAKPTKTPCAAELASSAATYGASSSVAYGDATPTSSAYADTKPTATPGYGASLYQQSGAGSVKVGSAVAAVAVFGALLL